MIFRLLVLAILLGLAVHWLRRSLQVARRSVGHQQRAPAVVRELLPCSVCGVHVDATGMLRDAGGRRVCSPACRRQTARSA